ncbi:MAG: hypothetical protein E2O42_03620 [Nitrospina sp.]|nr:MAG: hypothetical protein E2O43_06970 [Nitrospina sp.]TDJ60942.1 MAG: hypothetical protein E2O42_03620 [Nitrospina sp.]
MTSQWTRLAFTIGIAALGMWIPVSSVAGFGVVLQPPMRAACSLSLNDTTPIIEEVGVADRTGTASIVSASSISADGMWFRINGFTGATAGNPAISKEDAILTCDAEL